MPSSKQASATFFNFFYYIFFFFLFSWFLWFFSFLFFFFFLTAQHTTWHSKQHGGEREIERIETCVVRSVKYGFAHNAVHCVHPMARKEVPFFKFPARLASHQPLPIQFKSNTAQHSSARYTDTRMGDRARCSRVTLLLFAPLFTFTFLRRPCGSQLSAHLEFGKGGRSAHLSTRYERCTELLLKNAQRILCSSVVGGST